jgi:hypothetical protein
LVIESAMLSAVYALSVSGRVVMVVRGREGG